MRGSWSTRLEAEALTPEQSGRLAEFRERWIDIRLGNAAGDRRAAEDGVGRAYAAAGLAPPERVEWCDGPLELAADWEQARRSSAVGANVRSIVVDDVLGRVRAGMMQRVGPRMWDAVDRGVRARHADATGAAVVDAVTLRTRELKVPARFRIFEAIARLARLRKTPNAWLTFPRAGVAACALGSLSSYDFLRRVVGLEQETEALRGLEAVAANASWLLPHARVCWLAARHTALACDARGRLHSERGPALAFADGFSHYAWKGIEVPAEAIEAPGSISIARIDAEADVLVRRCLIEIMTPRRFVALGGATRAGQDETGILWRKTWWSGDSWAAVEVIDGTPGPDGIRKRYFLQVPPEMRSPRAAVAWSYGLTDQQYARLELRT